MRLSIDGGVAELRLARGKVNALNPQLVDEIAETLQRLAADPDVRAVILAADGPFFSFGFDIPEFIGYSRESFAGFLDRFTELSPSCHGGVMFCALSGSRCSYGSLLATSGGPIRRRSS